MCVCWTETKQTWREIERERERERDECAHAEQKLSRQTEREREREVCARAEKARPCAAVPAILGDLIRFGCFF